MSNAKQVQQVTPFVMSGTRHDVIELLHMSPNRRTVAVSLLDDEQVAAAESVFQRVTEFLPSSSSSGRQIPLRNSSASS